MTHHQNLPKISLEELRVEIQYMDTPDPSDALDFGAQGITFRACKPM